MTETRHETFTLVREIDAERAAVFEAFADDRIRRRWFRMPGSGGTYEHDFRVGGGEDAHSTFTMPDGSVERLRNRSRYLDLVVGERIVFVYEAIVNDVTHWASLVAVHLADADAAPGCTTLTWTEQVTFLAPTADGADLPHLRTGTSLRLNGLQPALHA